MWFISLMEFKGEGGKQPGTDCLPLKMLMGNVNQERSFLARSMSRRDLSLLREQ